MRNWYVESFKELRALRPIKDAEDEANFTKMLRSLYMRHAGVVPVSPTPFLLPPLRRPSPFVVPPPSVRLLLAMYECGLLLSPRSDAQMMAKGVSELRRELDKQALLTEMPEIHQFLDGFYLSRIGIRILIGEWGPEEEEEEEEGYRATP